MQVELHDRLGSPLKVTATRLLIRDDYGNPIAICMEIGPNNILTATAKDHAKFDALLRSLGIKQTAVVTVMDEKDKNSSIIIQ